MNMMRACKSSDVSELYRMIQETLTVSYSGIYPDRAIQFFTDYHSKERILERHRNGRVVVLERDGKIVATGAIVKDEISGVFVDPERQGNGLGFTIMQELEEYAQICGIHKLTLSVSLPAKKFYEKLHYTLSAQCRIDVGEGQFLKYWPASKKIGSIISR